MRGASRQFDLPREYLDQDLVRKVRDLEERHGFKAAHVYSQALSGFAAELTAEQIQALQYEADIEYVEPDGIVTIGEQTLPWGLARIQANLSTARARYADASVPGVNLYVIDTGIAPHPALNVVEFLNFSGDGRSTDCHGHGTHVAGILAARATDSVAGAAPGAPLTALKVMTCDGSGYVSRVIQAIDWITANARRPAVANLSLGGPASQALDEAVRRSAAGGVVYSIAAMNSGRNACNISPARAGTAPGVITVGATDWWDEEAWFSNYGACVDIWAPGVWILSTSKDGGTAVMSGTSMAAPHAGGAAALYLARYGDVTPEKVEAQCKSDAFVITNVSKDGRAISIVNAGLY